MATKLEESLELIRAGLQDEARQNLIDSGAVASGFLRDNTNVILNGDDFIVRFPDYGVFIDQGTQFVSARPFYSNLVVSGDADGEYEDEIEEILEDAFNEDVETLGEDFNTMLDL